MDDLTDLCQKHEAALPEEVKACLKGLKASQEVPPSQAASQASQSWQSAAGKLKQEMQNTRANSIRKARQNWSQWKPQWPTVAEAAYWQPPKKPKTPKAPLPNKVLQALGVAWDHVPEEVQKNLQEAGYKPPKAEHVQLSLVRPNPSCAAFATATDALAGHG